ncbi:MAG: 50S ribosomal protein L6 [Candidatus Eiseniibacteriota bacterium]|nr:MAG: 50S ribosomal protein L6 [Candidatus Eisenbacteria bacterium]
MSRVGKMPVRIPEGVTVKLSGSRVEVKGPRGELSTVIPRGVSAELKENLVQISVSSKDPKARALHGTARALVSNLVVGVSKGFRKVLEIVGTGYRAQMEGKKLVLTIGFAKPVEYPVPAGVQISLESPTRIIVEGSDKILVGQVASEIRDFKRPEPYKGKGIRYEGEYVRKKAGKAAVGAGG